MYGITNAGAGAAGGLSANAAVLHVRAPVNSTVTITKGGSTKTVGPQKAHIDSSDSTSAIYLFPVATQNFGEWTVSSSGVNTDSKTVVISANNEYDVELLYIPAGYKRLSYIETSGTQALRLTFPSMDLFGSKIEADVTVLQISGNQANLLANGANARRAYYLYAYNSNLYGISSENGGSQGNNINSMLSLPLHYVYDINTSTRAFTVTINNTQICTGTRAALVGTYFDAFAESGSGGTGLRWFSKVRCEGITIYNPSDHTEKLFDLVPAMRLSDSVVGMINLVDGTFYVNTGTGTFLYGE